MQKRTEGYDGMFLNELYSCTINNEASTCQDEKTSRKITSPLEEIRLSDNETFTLNVKSYTRT